MALVTVIPWAADDVGISQGRDLISRRGKLVSPPLITDLDAYTFGDQGLYVQGYRGKTLVISAWESGDDLYLTATCSGQSVTQLVPRYARGYKKFNWAALADKVIGCNGGQVIEFDTKSFAFSVVVFSTLNALESMSSSYLLDGPRAAGCVSYQGCMVYYGLEDAQLEVSAAVSYEQLDDPSVLVEVGGRLTYKKSQFLWSDPYRPDAVQAVFFRTVDDYDAVIQKCVSVGSGENAGLLIVCNRGLYLMQGYDAQTRVMTNISRSVGCPAPDTIREYMGVVYFMGQDGFYKWSMQEGLSKIGNFERLWLRQGDFFGSINWYPEDTAYACIGSAFPYYVVSCPSEETLLYIDLATGTYGIHFPQEFPDTMVNLGLTGLISQNVDIISGNYTGLYNFDWDGAENGAGTCRWSVFGPFDLGGTPLILNQILVKANETGGVLEFAVCSGEFPGNIIQESTLDLQQVHNGAFSWNGSVTLQHGDVNDSARLLSSGATSGYSFLSGTPKFPTTTNPKTLPSVVGWWELKPNVRGRSFYLLLRHTKDAEPLTIHALSVNLEAGE